MKRIVIIASAICLAFATSCSNGKKIDIDRVVSNPIDLNYQFTVPEELPQRPEIKLPKEYIDEFNATNAKRNGGREAADPVVFLFKDKYYLFPSKSRGYWSSDDMLNWNYIECNSLPIDLYAPSGMVYNDELYWIVSDINHLYKTATPEDGDSWVLVTDKLMPYPETPQKTGHDPELFVDDDNRVYFYWGCSNVDNIYGIQLDPVNNFASVGNTVCLIEHNNDIYGWENPGHKNEQNKPGWNEGPCMIKYDGKYYLQYAGPGTEFDTYADGLYVSDSPLGPFTYVKHSPFSIKPGGWMTGAGHGDTFQDKYGNYWHVATTVISQRFDFERRVGLFPVIITEKGNMHALTAFSDYPWVMPDKKVDFLEEYPWTGWMNLTINKKADASSAIAGCGADKAADNSIKTMWSAASGQKGEWFSIDLGKVSDIYAIQTNFADKDFGFYSPSEPKTPYRYIVEISEDGQNWTTAFDKSDNDTDNPHSLLVLEKPMKGQFVKITNCDQLTGKFSIYDLRVFGFSEGKAPARVKGIKAKRDKDERRIEVSWDPVEGAVGYLLRWGADPDELYSSIETLETSVEQGVYSIGTSYYFTVDAYNESGITLGKKVVSVK